jgi:hypothetical protein
MRAFVLAVVLSVFLVGCGRGPASELEARKIAKRRFSQVCANFHLMPADYDDPTLTSVGGAPFAYEWRKKGKKQDGVLITVAIDGVTNISFLTR